MRTVLVCGFGRSGTSLMMQMLAAGGYPMTGEYPSFECDEVVKPRQERFWARSEGKAVKLLDPHKFGVPKLSKPPLVIWMRRDYVQQAKSFVKFLNAMMPGMIDLTQTQNVEDSLRRDEDSITKLLPHRNIFCFEDVLTDSIIVAEMLRQMTGFQEFDIFSAAAVVRLRSADCLPGLLEAELISSPWRIR